jgi:hypothetical protein
MKEATTANDVHEGGCACGAVRYRVHAKPAFGLVCHCRFCQRRLGSAFAVIAYFNGQDVEITQGRLTLCEHRSDESGRWLRMEFCPQCGTTITHTTEMRPEMRAIAAGTFDDPDWFRIERHIWTRSARPWVRIPPDVAEFPQSAAGAAAATVKNL